MERHEEFLLEGAVKRSKTILVYGMESKETEILSLLDKIYGKTDTWDLKTKMDTISAEDLRKELHTRLTKEKRAIVLFGSNFSEAAKEVFDEMTLQGKLQVEEEGDPFKLEEDMRVIAVSDAKTQEEKTMKAFGVCVCGMHVIRDARRKVRESEEDLRAAQERAIESSRQHGLVD